MGQDKASLSLGDVDLLSWQEQRFKQAGFSVVSRLNDVFTGFYGPLAGLHAACHHYPQIPAWLVVPVDMPALSNAALHLLWNVGQQSKKAVCFERCPLPLYVPNSSYLKQTLTDWLTDENGRRSVYALFDTLQGGWITDHAFQQQLVNINTPEQWQQFNVGAEKV